MTTDEILDKYGADRLNAFARSLGGVMQYGEQLALAYKEFGSDGREVLGMLVAYDITGTKEGVRFK